MVKHPCWTTRPYHMSFATKFNICKSPSQFLCSPTTWFQIPSAPARKHQVLHSSRSGWSRPESLYVESIETLRARETTARGRPDDTDAFLLDSILSIRFNVLNMPISTTAPWDAKTMALHNGWPISDRYCRLAIGPYPGKNMRHFLIGCRLLRAYSK
jgi:hypothetical protein